MAYIDIVREYSEKNQFEYNHEAMFAQVCEAMKQTGAERAQTLRNIMKVHYISDVKKYEPMRNNKKFEVLGLEGREYTRAAEKLQEMANAVSFLEQYISIINAMAKDADDTYEPEFMLGMELSEAQNLINFHLDAYTRLEQAKHDLKTNGWRYALKLVEDARYSKQDKTVRNYATADEEEQGKMSETYIRKQMVKEELETMGFFQKYFSIQGILMRYYVRTAERALKDVKFPKEAEERAVNEFSKSVTLENEYEIYHNAVAEIYTEHAKSKNVEQQPTTNIANNEKKKGDNDLQKTVTEQINKKGSVSILPKDLNDTKKVETIDNSKKPQTVETEKKTVPAPQQDVDEDDELDFEENFDEKLEENLKDLPKMPEIDIGKSCQENGDLIMDSQRFAAEFKKNIWDMIKDKTARSLGSDIDSLDKDALVNNLCNVLVNNAKRINKTYDEFQQKKMPEEKFEHRMNDHIEDMFRDSFDNLSKTRMTAASKAVLAQRLTNLMLNTATAVAFDKENMEAYSHNYAFNDDGIMKNVLGGQAGSVKMVQKIIDGARKEMADFEKEPISVDEANFVARNEISQKVSNAPQNTNERARN